jgi:hypothetical protein
MFRGDGSVELFTEFINPIVVTNKLDLRIILNMDAGSVLEFIEGGLFAFAPFAPPFQRSWSDSTDTQRPLGLPYGLSTSRCPNDFIALSGIAE